ncbi:unnamed protein product [Parnassius mnemosyne]|uniref:MADF domain-containing protein n=1 Tax=Parnassius mnemosyne TaxID=213953 RepID=A0AAV1L2J0_9NEOP
MLPFAFDAELRILGFAQFIQKSSEMETEAFNTELFIDEIEKRPAVWDMTSSVYSDKNLRRRAWEELVLIFCEGDENEEKKKRLSTT